MPAQPMNQCAILGISVVMSLLSSIMVAALFVWPWLRTMQNEQALMWLVAPHMFLRFIGLSFLPGVVSESLAKAWAAPAAYGDLVAGILAIIATTALAIRLRGQSWRSCLFNVWGAADLLFAFYQGARVEVKPGSPDSIS